MQSAGNSSAGNYAGNRHREASAWRLITGQVDPARWQYAARSRVAATQKHRRKEQTDGSMSAPKVRPHLTNSKGPRRPLDVL